MQPRGGVSGWLAGTNAPFHTASHPPPLQDTANLSAWAPGIIISASFREGALLGL